MAMKSMISRWILPVGRRTFSTVPRPQRYVRPRFSLSPGVNVRPFPVGFCQQQWMSSDISQLPQISDPDVKTALSRLLAINWLNIDEETKDLVEAGIAKKDNDPAGVEILANVWRAAEAVEKFSGTLVALKMELSDLSGFGGENVKELPSDVKEALHATLTRYNNYLAAFEEHETYLKKKVETELGTLLIHIRQRCSGLGPEWGNISLLGTSGLSGSYIEQRRD